MKKFTFILIALFACSISYGQIRVITNGDVGIGTTTPTEQLEVAGIAKTEGNTVEKTGGSATTLYERTSFAAMLLGTGAQAGFTFDKNYNFEIRANFRGNVLNRQLSLGSRMLTGKGSTGFVAIGAAANPTEQLHVSGNIFASGTITPSDKRLKDNVQKFDAGLDVVRNMNIIEYNYNGMSGIKSDIKHIGVYAQELQEIAPFLVGSYIHVVEDEEGNAINEEEYLNIHDSSIKYVLINAIKEQQEMIDDKDAEIKALTDRLTSLEKVVMNMSDGNSSSTNTQTIEINKSRLAQNAPNPFTENTVINYTVPTKAQNAVLQVFDINGQMLKSVSVAQGNGQLTINARELSSGIYTYTLVVDGIVVDTKKMVLTK